MVDYHATLKSETGLYTDQGQFYRATMTMQDAPNATLEAISPAVDQSVTRFALDLRKMKHGSKLKTIKASRTQTAARVAKQSDHLRVGAAGKLPSCM